MAEVDVTTEPSAGGAAATPAEAPPPSESSANPPDAVADAASPPATAPDGGGTIAEDTGEDDVAPESPANWPTNWREVAAGGDKKTEQYLNRYNSPANVVKALMATRQKISSGEMLKAKPDGEDEAALNEWRAQAGIPEKPGGYLDKLPDGLVIGEGDEARVESFLAKMHAADVPPGHVHESLKWYYELQEQQAAEQAETDRTSRAQNDDTLRSEWGPEYRANLNGIHALLATHGNEELTERLFSSRFADGLPLGNDPVFLGFLSAVSREMNPHGTVVPNTGETVMQTINSELAQLQTEMADTKGPYWNGPESESKQARLRELYEMQDKHKGRAA